MKRFFEAADQVAEGSNIKMVLVDDSTVMSTPLFYLDPNSKTQSLLP